MRACNCGFIKLFARIMNVGSGPVKSPRETPPPPSSTTIMTDHTTSGTSCIGSGYLNVLEEPRESKLREEERERVGLRPINSFPSCRVTYPLPIAHPSFIFDARLKNFGTIPHGHRSEGRILQANILCIGMHIHTVGCRSVTSFFGCSCAIPYHNWHWHWQPPCCRNMSPPLLTSKLVPHHTHTRARVPYRMTCLLSPDQ